MREFLLELYLQHGEREFDRRKGEGLLQYKHALEAHYITYQVHKNEPFQLTLKALNYLKQNDS